MNNNFINFNGLAALPTASTAPNMVIIRRDPIPTDWQNFYLGTFWLNPVNETLWLLVSLAGNVATWIMLTGGSVGPVIKLTGDIGTAFPDLTGNINVEGAITAGRTVRFDGTIALHTLELFTSDAKFNTAIGNEAGNTGVGSNNTSLGYSALGTTGTGSNNTVIGYEAGLSYTTTEASNILIGSSVAGTAAESNVLRIGNGSGTGAGQLSTAYISGIAGVTTSNSQFVTINTVTDQLGSTADIVTTLHTQDGNNVTATAGVINLSGGPNLTTTGTAGPNTATVSLFGITEHALEVGGAGGNSLTQLALGTTGQILMGATGADPVWSSLAALSWTPTLAFGGSSAGIVYGIQEGHYQQIGDFVFFSGGLTLTSKGAAVGVATINGLPFASGALFQTQFGPLAINQMTLDAGQTYAWCIVNPGTTQLLTSGGGSGANQTILTNTNYSDTTQISFTGFYFTA